MEPLCTSSFRETQARAYAVRVPVSTSARRESSALAHEHTAARGPRRFGESDFDEAARGLVAARKLVLRVTLLKLLHCA